MSFERSLHPKTRNLQLQHSQTRVSSAAVTFFVQFHPPLPLNSNEQMNFKLKICLQIVFYEKMREKSKTVHYEEFFDCKYVN